MKRKEIDLYLLPIYIFMDRLRKILIVIACLLLILAFIIVTAFLTPRYGEDNLLKAIARVLFETVEVYR